MVPASEDQDAVLAEERYSGIVRAHTDDFHAALRDPLIQAIHDENLEWEEVEDYLHARHAPSRNAAMREINPTQEELDDRTETLSAERDRLAQDERVKQYVSQRRQLRDAQADIADGIADESLERHPVGDPAPVRPACRARVSQDGGPARAPAHCYAVRGG